MTLDRGESLICCACCVRLHARMARTALIIIVSEAEEAVGAIRLRNDRSAALGVPAHITILFPFADSRDLEEDALAELFAAKPAFDFTLDRLERWSNGSVWLHPDPSLPFEELTATVVRRWPHHLPYAGTVDTVIPHLTVSETPIDLELDLPIASHAHEITLIEEQPDENWAVRKTFALGEPCGTERHS